MKILYIASVRIPNEKASGLAIMRQCEAFARIGHEVTLLRPYRKNNIVEDPFVYYGIEPNFKIKTMRGFDIISSGKVGFFLMRMWQMLYVFGTILMNRRSFEIIYTRDPWMAVLPVFFGLRRRTLVEVHKTYTSSVVDRTIQRARCVICITRGLARHFSEFTGRTDILVEPSGVNTAQFDTAPTRAEARTRYGLPHDAKIVGFIGKYRTMGEEKGVDDLIAAFGSICTKRPDTHLFIVGLESDEINEVRTFALNVGIPLGCLTILPLIQKDFASYIVATDILVMNYPDTEHYRTYMSPTKLFAYMASGNRIVSTDLPSVREIVDETVVYFAEPSNCNSLRGAIEQALDATDEESERRGILAKEQVRRFSWDSRAERITLGLKQ